MPASLVVQQIDDVVACGPPEGKHTLVADRLGVVLASRDDPWWIGDEKLAIILKMLRVNFS